MTLALSFSACGSKNDDDDTGGSDVTDDAGDDALEEAEGMDEGGDESDDPMTGSVSGSFVGEDGAAMTVANIKLCTPMLCRTTEPDGDGNFTFIELEESAFALEIKSEDEASAKLKFGKLFSKFNQPFKCYIIQIVQAL